MPKTIARLWTLFANMQANSSDLASEPNTSGNIPIHQWLKNHGQSDKDLPKLIPLFEYAGVEKLEDIKWLKLAHMEQIIKEAGLRTAKARQLMHHWRPLQAPAMREEDLQEMREQRSWIRPVE